MSSTVLSGLMSVVSVLIIAIYSATAWADLPARLVFGAAEWCPYTCSQIAEGKSRQGIVGRYVTELLNRKGVNLEIRFLPWKRAVRSAEEGKLDGLITVVPSEVDRLLITNVPTIYHKVCLYTRFEENWKYASPDSLQNRKLGAVEGYGYGDFINRHIMSSDVLLINGDNLIVRLHNLLLQKRIDMFVSNDHVYRFAALHARLNTEAIQRVHCFESTPLFLAVRPGQIWSQGLLELFNKSLTNPGNIERLKEIKTEFLESFY